MKRIRSYETLLGLAQTALHAPGRRASEMPDGSLLTDLLYTEYPAVAALGWITGQDEAVGADDVRYRFRGIPSVAGCSRQTFDLTATSQVADTLSRAGERGAWHPARSWLLLVARALLISCYSCRLWTPAATAKAG